MKYRVFIKQDKDGIYVTELENGFLKETRFLYFWQFTENLGFLSYQT